MIDLTNKTIDEINALIIKYAKILELLNPQEQPYFAYIIDIAIKHIDEKYDSLNKNWKTSIIFILKKLSNKINNESDIKMIVDEFIKYYNNEYAGYCEEMICIDEVDREFNFVYKFIKEKSW